MKIGGVGIIYGSDLAPEEITQKPKSICGPTFQHSTI
jgi:hypothetical protein